MRTHSIRATDHFDHLIKKKNISCTVFDVLIFRKTHISDMMGFNFIHEILGNCSTDR